MGYALGPGRKLGPVIRCLVFEPNGLRESRWSPLSELPQPRDDSGGPTVIDHAGVKQRHRQVRVGAWAVNGRFIWFWHTFRDAGRGWA